MEKINTRLIKSLLFGSITISLNLFIALFLTPMIIEYVGIDAYGFVSLSGNIISYLSIITIALNAYSARYISVAYLRKDLKGFNIFCNTVFWGDFAIGIGVLLLLVFFIINIDSILVVPERLVCDLKLLFIFVGLNFFISLISVVWKVYSQIRDRVDLSNMFEGVGGLIQLILLCVMFGTLKPNIWYVGFAAFVPSLFVLLMSIKQTIKLLPEMRLKVSDVSGSAFKTLVVKGIWNSIDGLGNILNSGLDLLITDLMLTPVDMGKVSVSKSISGLIPRFYSMISQSFYPKILSAYSNNNIDELIARYKKSMRVCASFTNIIFACFIFIGEDFLNIWIPNQDIKTIYILTLLSIAPCIIEGVTYPLYSVYMLTTKIMVPTLMTIVSGFINIVSMYLLLKHTGLGVYAVVATTAVIVTIAHFVTPVYACSCLRIENFTFVPTLVQAALGLSVNILILFFFDSLIGAVAELSGVMAKVIVMGGLSFVVQIVIMVYPEIFWEKLKKGNVFT